jgi:hypothetical protein
MQMDLVPQIPSLTYPIERLGLSGFLDVGDRGAYNHVDDDWGDRTHCVPHEVLFGFAGAPKGDEENLLVLYERYYKNLPPKLELPESDILKAIHAYTSDFFSVLPGKEKGFMSMDHTALLAAGILLEEMAIEAVGETGHFALLESARMQSGRAPVFWNGRREVPFYYEGNQPKEKTESEDDDNKMDEDEDESEPSDEEMSDEESASQSDTSNNSASGGLISVNISSEDEAADEPD